jgi:hypothetical protein
VNYSIKIYGLVDLLIHIFLTLALVGGEWSAWCPGCFSHWTGGRVGARTDIDDVQKVTFLAPYWGSTELFWLFNWKCSVLNVYIFCSLLCIVFQCLTCQPGEGYLFYRSTSVLFQLIFEWCLLEKLPRTAFLPWETKRGTKRWSKLTKVSMYLV